MDPALPTVRGHFRFLAGEFSLATWKPLLAEAAAPPPAPGPGVPGYLLRRQPPESFPLGISRSGPWLAYVPRQERLYLVDLAGGFDQYLAAHSAKTRHNLKRALKKLAERNPESLFRVFSEPGEMAEFQRLAGEISRHTYQEKLLNAGLPRTPAFLAHMEDKARRGEARGYLLYDQGQPIAYAWCSARGATLSYEIIGYLPDRAPLSPGTVLLYLIVEDLFRLGRYAILDFGVGDSEYKRLFSTRALDYIDVHLFRPTLRNALIVRAHWWLDRFNTRLGRLLDRLGLKARVRKWLRRLRAA